MCDASDHGTPLYLPAPASANPGGTIAGQKVVKAIADGYTLFMASGSEVSIALLFNPAVKYNGETDFTAIGLVGDVPLTSACGTACSAPSKCRQPSRRG